MSPLRRSDRASDACSVLALLLAASAVRSLADDTTPTPDKSGYTLFDPTPDADLRSFNTDRPPKANSPYTVDAGHFQYEIDLAVFGYAASLPQDRFLSRIKNPKRNFQGSKT